MSCLQAEAAAKGSETELTATTPGSLPSQPTRPASLYSVVPSGPKLSLCQDLFCRTVSFCKARTVTKTLALLFT